MPVASSPTFARGSLEARAVAEWRKGKDNTFVIAKHLGWPEPEVCKAIAADQDARFRASQAAEAGAGR